MPSPNTCLEGDGLALAPIKLPCPPTMSSRCKDKPVSTMAVKCQAVAASVVVAAVTSRMLPKVVLLVLLPEACLLVLVLSLNPSLEWSLCR